MSSCHYLMIRVFQCEESLTGILTGVYDAWGRRLGHANMTTTQKTYLHIIQELENKDVDLVMRTLSGL